MLGSRGERSACPGRPRVAGRLGLVVAAIVMFGDPVVSEAVASPSPWSDPIVVDAASHRVTGIEVGAGPGHFTAVVWTRPPSNRSSGPSRGRGWIVASVRGRHSSRFGRPVILSGRGASSPRVGVSGTGQTVVMWIGREHHPRAIVRRPGLGWGSSRLLSSESVVGAGKLAVARDGRTIATWVEGPSRSRRIAAAAMRPGGSFAPPEVLAADQELGTLPFFDVAVANLGHGAVAWNGDCPAPTRVAFLASNGEFSSPEKIPNSRCASAGIRIAVDNEGGASALISGYLDASRVRASIRQPNGTFPPARRISHGTAVNGELSMSQDGKAVAIWGLFHEAGSPRGIAAAIRQSTEHNFGPQRRISGPHGGGLEVLAMNPRGEAVAIWQSLRSFRLEASVAPVTGAFHAPERVSPRLSRRELAEPAVAISPRGRAVAAWPGSPRKGGLRKVLLSYRASG